MLYLIGTPIGNLEDITLRALRLLGEVDYVLCEDTRVSKRLFEHHGIKTPLRSFHAFSEKGKEEGIITDLKGGKKVGLISDAGMPALSDPGSLLIQRCHTEGLPVSVIPGPSAITAAASLYGVEGPFQFIGFLPKKGFRKQLAQIVSYEGISILFESPHRVAKTLSLLPPQTPVCVMRELTKIYEESLFGTAETLSQREYRGECVLLIQGTLGQTLSDEHIVFLRERLGLSERDAFKMLAKLFAENPKEL